MQMIFQNHFQLLVKKHDITGIRIYDRFEEEIPNIGFVPMIDQESFELKYIDTSSSKIRAEYKTKCLARKNYFETLFKRNGSGTISCRTDQDYVKLLLGYFKNRG